MPNTGLQGYFMDVYFITVTITLLSIARNLKYYISETQSKLWLCKVVHLAKDSFVSGVSIITNM